MWGHHSTYAVGKEGPQGRAGEEGGVLDVIKNEYFKYKGKMREIPKDQELTCDSQ